MHKADTMTPIERMAAFEAGKPMDRYPVMPFIGVIAPKVAEMTQKEMRQSAENIARAQIAAYERFGHDTVSVEYSLYGLGEALGSVLSDPEDSIPALLETVINNLDEVDNLSLAKAQPEYDNNLHMLMEAAEILNKKLGQECSVGATIPGVLTSAAGIYKIDDMLRSMYKEPDKLHKLLRFCTDALKNVAAEFINMGLSISVADPIASGTVIRAAHYREFVKPYATEFTEYVHNLENSVCYHICGQAINIINDMVDTGADVLSIDNKTNIYKVRELAGDKICIIGNVDPVDIIMQGSRKEIWEAVRACYLCMYDSPKGYLLATGCDIPGATPLENVDAFMEAARYYGKWPVDLEKLQRPAW